MPGKHIRRASCLSPLLLLPLLAGCILISSCFAIIVDRDGDPGDSPGGRLGSGGSIHIVTDDAEPFSMSATDSEVTLVVRGRTIILPHSGGRDGITFTDLDFERGEIRIDLGDGVTVEVEGHTLEANGQAWVLDQPGTYRIDVVTGSLSFTRD